jgi:hypothetical protein
VTERTKGTTVAQLNRTEQRDALLHSTGPERRAALRVRPASEVVLDDYRVWAANNSAATAAAERFAAEHQDERLQGPETDEFFDTYEPLAHQAEYLRYDIESLMSSFGGRYAPSSVHLEHAEIVARPVVYAEEHIEPSPYQVLALELLDHRGNWHDAYLAANPATNRDVLQDAMHQIEADRRTALLDHAAASGMTINERDGALDIPDDVALSRREIAPLVQRAAISSGRQDVRVTPSAWSQTAVTLNVGSTTLNIEYAPAGPAHTTVNLNGRDTDYAPGPDGQNRVHLDAPAITCTEVLRASSERDAYVVAIGGRHVAHSLDDTTALLQRWIREEGRRQDNPRARLAQRIRNTLRTTAIHRPAAADRTALRAHTAVAAGTASATPAQRDTRTAEVREQIAQTTANTASTPRTTIVVPAPTTPDTSARDAARLAQISSPHPTTSTTRTTPTERPRTAPSPIPGLER